MSTCKCGHLERHHDNEASSCDVAGCTCEIFTECTHPNAEETGRYDGWPSGDIVMFRCPDCGETWETELPQ